MIEIVGKKVALKKASNKDIDVLYYWKYEEKEQKAKEWNSPYILEEKLTKEEFQEYLNREVFGGIPAALAIQINGIVVGKVGCYWIDENTNWLETGIVIFDSRFWNSGYGSEAYQLWIDFIFSSTPIHRLGMSTWSGNARMMKVAEKLGMKEEARIREARMVNGQYYDAIKMGILRKEWEQRAIEKHALVN